MQIRPKFEIDEFWPAGLLGLLCALPLTITLWLAGIGILPSAIFGLLVGLFGALALLSEEYKFLRIICALIGAGVAIVLSLHVHLSVPLTLVVVGFGIIIGYFARKWIDFIWYAS